MTALSHALFLKRKHNTYHIIWYTNLPLSNKTELAPIWFDPPKYSFWRKLIPHWKRAVLKYTKNASIPQ